ncbi:hypothetical protein [Pseudomonas proteolytica]|uniref:hypothetical protein n=1 Tax=Pseudomonas proteolytica TaxID=219574 RepID=UPI001472E726|nr:hypothetical protein [Pseudomonas proteolytica]NMZ37070.1 hypothetical protein [Pseudomonas proteolytica]
MGDELNKLQPLQGSLVELWQDRWTVQRPRDFLINSAQSLRPMLERLEYRRAFNSDESSRILYTELRYMLLVLSKSKLAAPRRLTWRERITGRLNP